jgi:superfamily II DNA or RNA helicase
MEVKAEVTPDKRFIQIVDASELEMDQIRHSFKKRISNWRFHPLVKKRVWDGYISFIDRYNRIPIGLWNELNQTCAKYHFKLEVGGFESVIDNDFDEEDFRSWVNEFFSDHPKITPRDYQVDACIPILKYRRNISEIATSAGKTLIMFMLFAYMIDRKKANRLMIVVPNTNLIIQTNEDFELYNNNKMDFKTQLIHGGTDKTKKEVDLIIGTYQSLVKRELHFFEGIDAVLVDEAHHTNASSIKKILVNCMDATYAVGLSGTMLQNGSTEALTIQAYLGPLVNNISASFLTENKYATPIQVKIVQMDYIGQEIREKLESLREQKNSGEFDGAKLLDVEKRLVVENRPRFLYVANFICKTTKNSLVLFQNVKDSYGRRIYDYIRENTADKEVFYVDGSTPPDLREDYINRMEEGSNKILVASFGTFSTGISINNIHNVFFVESYKSEKIVRQSIGRGMRLCEGKEKVNIIDFVDDFTINSRNKNYLLKHGEDRMKIYKQQGFPYKLYKVTF